MLLSLIQETQQPDGNLIVVSNLCIIARIESIVVESYLARCMGIAHTELTRAVDKIVLRFASLAHDVVASRAY